jgi:L-ascorbate metabolism protein UlaG (beta-lactamase superfamily)
MKQSLKNLLFLLKFGVHPQNYDDIDVEVNDGKALQKNTSKHSITYIGQSTCLLQIDGINILTDPNWAKSLYFFKRYSKPGIAITNLPSIDIVLLSHAHFDHLHFPTLKKICTSRTTLICENTVAPLVKNIPGSIRSGKIGDTLDFQTIKFHLVPVKHNGDRYMWDTFRQCTGFIIEGSGGPSIFFPGDTAYTPLFKDIGKKHAPDITLMPIGDFEPRYVNQHTHIHPCEVPQALQDLQTRMMIPIHWGTFQLSHDKLLEPLEEVTKHLKTHNMQDSMKILKHGETLWR